MAKVPNHQIGDANYIFLPPRYASIAPILTVVQWRVEEGDMPGKDKGLVKVRQDKSPLQAI